VLIERHDRTVERYLAQQNTDPASPGCGIEGAIVAGPRHGAELGAHLPEARRWQIITYLRSLDRQAPVPPPLSVWILFRRDQSALTSIAQ
jgi:hypothetical protein